MSDPYHVTRMSTSLGLAGFWGLPDGPGDEFAWARQPDGLVLFTLAGQDGRVDSLAACARVLRAFLHFCDQQGLKPSGPCLTWLLALMEARTVCHLFAEPIMLGVGAL